MIIKKWTEQQKQKFARFQEILNTGQRYLEEAGGNPRLYKAGFKDQDYLTDEERQEAAKIMRHNSLVLK